MRLFVFFSTFLYFFQDCFALFSKFKAILIITPNWKTAYCALLQRKAVSPAWRKHFELFCFPCYYHCHYYNHQIFVSGMTAGICWKFVCVVCASGTIPLWHIDHASQIAAFCLCQTTQVLCTTHRETHKNNISSDFRMGNFFFFFFPEALLHLVLATG